MWRISVEVIVMWLKQAIACASEITVGRRIGRWGVTVGRLALAPLKQALLPVAA
jgi:hypothetical protein